MRLGHAGEVPRRAEKIFLLFQESNFSFSDHMVAVEKNFPHLTPAGIHRR
jgi:hypothetical protein